MRFCNKNKINIWYTPNCNFVDETDDNGNYTGNTIIEYEKPIKTAVNMYPANGSIVEDIFGKNCNLDYVVIDNNDKFNEYTVFFINEPLETDDLSTTYDYYVDQISKSINHTQYGLVKRQK